MNFDNIWCWLIPLLVGLISAILGYLWGKANAKTETKVVDNSADLSALKSDNAKLKADLEACNSKLKAATTLGAAGTVAAASLTSNAADIPFDAAAAQAVYGKKIKQDDLKVVEGIGPKIEQLFHSFGIKTWKKLSETSVEKCQEVLDSGGERYRVHDPGSWPLQSKMAYEGKWKELAKWQEEHKHGKL